MRALPYLLPVCITSVFIVTADTGFVWLAVGLIFIVAFLRKSIGKFTIPEIVSEYKFFHHDRSMAYFKSVCGIFFVLFNSWIPWFLYTHELNGFHLAVFLYSVVILNSNFSVSLAHDLMHSRRRFDRFLCTWILLMNGFFYLESDHIYIHHRHVGTPSDPATAREGENIYRYFRRSISARFKMILLRGNTFPKELESGLLLKNRLRFLICITWLAVSAFLGAQVFLSVLVSYFFVTLIYESITYIQHYGLKRNLSENGRSEPVQLNHAWNCYYKTSAYLHFMMPVHSIHHLKEENLEVITDDAGRTMPKPFASMMITALFPRRWFRLMETNEQAS